MLVLTGTNLSVPALTGAIMTHGRGDRQRILVSLCARAARQGTAARAAALEAGPTRLRPVLMTASP